MIGKKKEKEKTGSEGSDERMCLELDKKNPHMMENKSHQYGAGSNILYPNS